MDLKLLRELLREMDSRVVNGYRYWYIQDSPMFRTSTECVQYIRDHMEELKNASA